MNIPDPDKVLRLVVVVLPGFIILGLFSYGTDLYFPEFAFTYIALSLSVLVYVLTDTFFMFLNRRRATRGVAALGIGVYILLVSVLIVVITPVLLVLHHTEALLAPLGLVTRKLSHEWPLSYVLKRNQYRQDICGMDRRPFAAWKERQCKALNTPVPQGARPSYYAFARVFVKDSVYEGDIAYWQATADQFQLGLVQACRVDVRTTPMTIEPVNGPIVTIFSKEVTHIEFIEQLSSPCYLYYRGLS